MSTGCCSLTGRVLSSVPLCDTCEVEIKIESGDEDTQVTRLFVRNGHNTPPRNDVRGVQSERSFSLHLSGCTQLVTVTEGHQFPVVSDLDFMVGLVGVDE